MKSVHLLSILVMIAGAFSSVWAKESEEDSDYFPRSEIEHIRACLKQWKKHPFSEKSPEFTTLRAPVRVLGVGRPLVDSKETNSPKLILVKTGANVLSGSKYRFLNPNGWYCFKGSTTVLGKSMIEVACDSHIASSGEDFTILGSNKEGHGGTAVLGGITLKRVGCKKKDSDD